MIGLQDYISAKPTPYVRVQECSAVQDTGLYEGFEWVVDRIVEIARVKA